MNVQNLSGEATAALTFAMSAPQPLRSIWHWAAAMDEWRASNVTDITNPFLICASISRDDCFRHFAHEAAIR
jgi:hypothetical protein